MTKDAYFEMCEMLGTEPLDEDIPTVWEDLPILSQQALELYGFLPDKWEGMSGTYMGKDYSIVFNLFNIYEIDNNQDQVILLKIMSNIDGIRSKIIHQKQKQKEKPS